MTIVASRKRIDKRASFAGPLAVLALMLAACSSVPTTPKPSGRIAQAVGETGIASNEINFVGKALVSGQLVAKSGGVARGTKELGETKWLIALKTTTGIGSITLLAPEDMQGQKLAELPTNAVSLESELRLQFQSRFAALRQITGKDLPPADFVFLLIPDGYGYRHDAAHTISEGQPNKFEFVLLVTTKKGSFEASLTRAARTAVHEFIHTLRWDEKSFPRKIAPAADEANAYLLEYCTAFLVRNQVPETVFSFPNSLIDVVGDYRDVAVDELYRQLVEQRADLPTTIGLSVAALAIHRYYSERRKTGRLKLDGDSALPMCKAAANDRLVWDSKEIEPLIAVLAQE
jgi:hypothetical protein